ncbi:hypothetical protein L195_g032344, partial [Trifolium pratense]
MCSSGRKEIAKRSSKGDMLVKLDLEAFSLAKLIQLSKRYSPWISTLPLNQGLVFEPTWKAIPNCPYLTSQLIEELLIECFLSPLKFTLIFLFLPHPGSRAVRQVETKDVKLHSHCFASFFAMRVKAAQKGLAFPITESTANSRPYLKRVTNVID